MKQLKAKAKKAIKELNEVKQALRTYQTAISENAAKIAAITEDLEQAEEQSKEIVRQVARGESTHDEISKARAAVTELSNKRADIQELTEAFQAEIMTAKERQTDLQFKVRSLRNQYFSQRFQEHLEKNASALAEAYALFNLSNQGQLRAPAPMMFISNLERLKPTLFRRSAVEGKVAELAKELL